MTNLANNIDFFKALNQEGLLTIWITFDRLKYSPLTEGGFLHRKDYVDICKELDISDSKLRHDIGRLKQMQLLQPSKTGYNIAGWRMLPESMGYEIKKILFKANKKRELIRKGTYCFLDNSIEKQIQEVNKHQSKGWLKHSGGTLKSDEKYTLSVRKIASTWGYKSAMTGSKIERDLQANGRIKIIRRSKRLCSIKEYNAIRQAYPDLSNRTFIKGNDVYERLCNNLIPIKKKASPEEEFISTLLKHAKRRYQLACE